MVDTAGMVRLMRYNAYTTDPLSACNCTPPYSAENAISARCDLNPRNGSYPFSALGHRSHGGTDMKLTSLKLQQTLQFIAQSGPTWDPLPPFRWSHQGIAYFLSIDGKVESHKAVNINIISTVSFRRKNKRKTS